MTADTPKRARAIQSRAVLGFILLVAASGAVMMKITSRAAAEGAAFLWLPAALQLVAAVWLGPWRGALVGGLGAYLAGILAYGGWGLVDILMNLVAGGLANAWLPAALFAMLRIDPSFGVTLVGERRLLGAMARLAVLLASMLALSFAVVRINAQFERWPGLWGYAPLLLLLLLAGRRVVRELAVRSRDFVLAILVCAASSLVSAAIGVTAQVLVVGKPWRLAAVEPGVGWFLGDTASAILGLYLLAALTERARAAGLVRG